MCDTRRPDDPLALFLPVISRWFRERLGRPTEIQNLTWPKIAAGEHVLVTAPTGSGKTLSAFLWALDRLASGEWSGGRVRLLYVSPLKALNADIRRNLLIPLNELREMAFSSGENWPDIRVLTRSGDTPQTERRRMLRRPPEILITTPESLNLLLSSNSGRTLLTELKTVILDEIHTVLGGKRGVHLITAVERLVPLSGEFQRIAISATVKPMSIVAEYIGGFRREGGVGEPRYIPRPVSMLRSKSVKSYELKIRRAAESDTSDSTEDFWMPMVREFREIIGKNRSTLFFARSRRLSESLTLKINAEGPCPQAYAHHGSLARELRREVESKLKSGALRAIVATNSLELGIDIGSLDEVVMVQSPPSVSSAVQRVGRAGHRVGEVSRGTFYPTYDLDYLEAAVIARSIAEGDIETIHPVEGALDVLSQVIVSMAATAEWDIDELFTLIRTAWPYRGLSRAQFDLVLEMLGGRYAATRVRELKPQVSIDRIDNTVVTRKGARLGLYFSGGTIPDRGYFQLRHEKTGALIGELDEEFVWEAKLGQRFNFGTQQWKINRITHNDVIAVPVSQTSMETPFWKGESFNRDFHLSQKIGEFLEKAESRLDSPEWTNELRETYFMEKRAAEHLTAFLKAQREETGRPLPHRRHMLVEQIASGPGGTPGNQMVLHTFLGGRVNRPFALAMEAAWEMRFGHGIEIFPGNDSIALLLPHDIPADELASLVTPGELEDLLRARLESSGYFGARFRENSGRALLLTRRKPTERLPLWMIRLRSQKLLQAVRRKSDFPILLETWRTCLRDEFDIPALKTVLTEIVSGEIVLGECRTSSPSPMARGLSWAQIDQYMYSGDEPKDTIATGLRSDLLHEVALSPGLRPTIPPDVIRLFERKRQRLAPGYPPATPRDLVDWVKERVLIPEREWSDLLQAMERDQAARGPEQDLPGVETIQQDGAGPEDIVEKAGDRLVRVRTSGGSALIASLENWPDIRHGMYAGECPGVNMLSSRDELLQAADTGEREGDDPDAVLTDLLSDWMSFYGPRAPEWIRATLGIPDERLGPALEDLRDTDAVIGGRLVEGEGSESVCDADNFESLLRLMRAAAAPRIDPRPIDELPLFLATYQGLASHDSGHEAVEGKRDELFRIMEQLALLPLPAPLWGKDILPARVPGFRVEQLDALLQDSGLRWRGAGREMVAFLFDEDDVLLNGEESAVPENGAAALSEEPDPAEMFPDPGARYDFSMILSRMGGKAAELESRLWEAVWAGRITNDTFSSLHRGLMSRFRFTGTSHRHRGARHPVRSAGRRRAGRPREIRSYPGSWMLLPDSRSTSDPDLMEIEERRKDRVRILLDRYGLLFRELLHKEAPPFRWPQLFRSLRLMELSGEVLSGYFFEGIPGPQFVSRRALGILRDGLPSKSVFWESALDPASPCGLPLEGLRGTLPRRIDGTHLVFRGKNLMMSSRRHGRHLTFHIPPEDPGFAEALPPLRHLLKREFDPVRRIIVDTINDEPAVSSPYLSGLRKSFDVVVDTRQVSLYRKRR